MLMETYSMRQRLGGVSEFLAPLVEKSSTAVLLTGTLFLSCNSRSLLQLERYVVGSIAALERETRRGGEFKGVLLSQIRMMVSVPVLHVRKG